MSCPEGTLLASLALGHAMPEQEGLVTHLAGCPRCRALTASLAAGERVQEKLSPEVEGILLRAAAKPARRWIPFAAAAALLAAVAVWKLPGTPSVKPAVPAMTPSRPAAEEDSVLIAGQATSVALKPGSRAVLVRRETLELLSGSAWIENPGEPLEVLLPGGSVSTTQATLLVEILPTVPAAFWLRVAHAAEGGTRVAVLSGSAMLKPEQGDAVILQAGQEARLTPAGVQGLRPASAAAWKGIDWHRVPGLRLRDGVQPLGLDEAGGSYIWEAVIRRLDPAAAVGVGFPAGGRVWELPLGAAFHEARGWLRVRVEVREDRVRMQAGPYEVLKEAVPGLGRRLGEGRSEPGLRVWGGDVEVGEARWKEVSP